MGPGNEAGPGALLRVPSMGPVWALHGPGLGPGPGWLGLTGTGSFDPVREKKFPGNFFSGEGQSQNPWPWSLQNLRFLGLPRIYQAIPWEFSVSYRVQQACTSEKKNPREFFFGPGPACWGPSPSWMSLDQQSRAWVQWAQVRVHGGDHLGSRVHLGPSGI